MTQVLQEKLQRHLQYLAQDQRNPHLLLSISECYALLGATRSAALAKANGLHLQAKMVEAIALLEQYCHENPYDADILGLLSLLYFDDANEEKSAWAVKETLKLDAAHPQGQLIGVLLKALHQQATLIELEALLEQHPEECRIWFALGATHLQQMNCTAAEQAFRKATQLHPHFYDAWIGLGRCLLMQNELKKAENAYKKSIAIDSNTADGYGGLACIDALNHQVNDAWRWLNKAEALDADCFEATLTRIFLQPADEKQVYVMFPEIEVALQRMLKAYKA